MCSIVVAQHSHPLRGRFLVGTGVSSPTTRVLHRKPLSVPAHHALAGSFDPLSLRPPKYLPLKAPLARSREVRAYSSSPLSAVGSSHIHRDRYLRTQLGITVNSWVTLSILPLVALRKMPAWFPS